MVLPLIPNQTTRVGLLVLLRQSPRTFVEQVGFVTSVGAKVRVVVTDLGILEPDAAGELTLTHLHPGATVEQAREATGWALKVVAGIGETEPPTDAELDALRALQGAAHV